MAMGELNERLIVELIEAVRAQLRKEAADRVRDVYLIGDIEKDTARACIEQANVGELPPAKEALAT